MTAAVRRWRFSRPVPGCAGVHALLNGFSQFGVIQQFAVRFENGGLGAQFFIRHLLVQFRRAVALAWSSASVQAHLAVARASASRLSRSNSTC